MPRIEIKQKALQTLHLARKTMRIIAFALVLMLLVFYLFVQDRTPLGEFVTIWPSFLWLFVILPMVLLGFRLRSRSFALIAALVIVFLATTVELRGLLPRRSPPRPSASHKPVLRVVTWNIDSASGGKSRVLTALEQHKPDICFLQETPDGDASFNESDLTGYWTGFHWIDSGDCGTLSRYAIRELPIRSVGPWSPPQILLAEMPSTGTMLLVNVRLMLPSLVLNPLSRDSRRRLVGSHSARLKQFERLAPLVRETAARENVSIIVLAGDFNTPGGIYSLHPLKTILRDVWPEAGEAWGATMTSSFPVSRIDQIWISSEIQPLRAKVFQAPISDHRMLLAELLLL